MEWSRGAKGSSALGKITFDACFSFLLLFHSFAAAFAQQSLETDRQALEKFMVAVDPTGNLLPWVTGTNPCTWIGVECYENRVAQLRLSGFQLAGPLPAKTLGDLDELHVLSLHHNQFRGAFPVDLARCTRLQVLFLSSNLFSGPLPDFTGYWPRMSQFTVGFNNFSGAFPASLNTLSALSVLDLQRNSLSGEIPAMPFANLLEFSVANNKLVGPVPRTLRKFPSESFAGNGGLCGPPTTKLCPGSVFAGPAVAPVAVPAAEISGDAAPIAILTTSKNGHKVISAGVIASIAIGVFVVIFLFAYMIFRPRDDNFDLSHVGKPARQYNGEIWTLRDQHSVDHQDFKESYAVRISSEFERSKLVFFDHGRKRPEFALEELLRASAVIIGKGSVGTSYRADLGGSVVVVKRLKDVAAERKDFEAHVGKIGRLHHRNLAPLRAYYFSEDEKLLLTDYMPRGSLHTLLHANRDGNRTPVDWITREKIALGSARALAHLHKESVKLAHGNIKSSNILLSRDMEPSLADYGLTCLLSPANVGAARFVGYRAVEVTDIRKITMQSDVYSFGVLLLELLTGKAPTQSNKDTGIDLPKSVMTVERDKWTSEVFDVELMRYNNFEDEMVQMLQLALACVDSIPERRPKMDEVVLLLEDITQVDTGDDSSRHSHAKSSSQKSRDSQACALIYTRPSSGVFVIGD